MIPRTFYAAGINYAAHIREMAEKRGVQPVFPEKADIGYRANNALIAQGEDVVIPKDATEKINYEGELVVVIGKQVKHLSKADAMSCVFGYTIGNDVSERPGSAATAHSGAARMPTRSSRWGRGSTPMSISTRCRPS